VLAECGAKGDPGLGMEIAVEEIPAFVRGETRAPAVLPGCQ
jgi:hypothetical protein